MRREEPPRGGMGMNTTTLIAEWSMSGARADVAARFRTADDILAILGKSPSETARPEGPRRGADPLLVKPAGEDDWRPLSGG